MFWETSVTLWLGHEGDGKGRVDQRRMAELVMAA